jgi:predicted lipase
MVQPKLVVKDSIHDSIIYVPQRTVVTIAGDSVQIHDTVNCPDAVYQKEVKSISGKTTASVTLFKGNLIVDCKADSMQHVIDWLQRELIRTISHSEVETVIKEVPYNVYRVPKWCWFLLGFNVLFFGFKIYKSVRKVAPHLP